MAGVAGPHSAVRRRWSRISLQLFFGQFALGDLLLGASFTAVSCRVRSATRRSTHRAPSQFLFRPFALVSYNNARSNPPSNLVSAGTYRNGGSITGRRPDQRCQ
jgi:hypothetical protein